jgi:hypothetical protein
MPIAFGDIANAHGLGAKTVGWRSGDSLLMGTNINGTIISNQDTAYKTQTFGSNVTYIASDAQGNIYVANGMFISKILRNGFVNWTSASLTGTSISCVGVAEDSSYVSVTTANGNAGQIYKLDANTGSTIWGVTNTADGTNATTYLYCDSTAIYSMSGGKLVSFSLTTGAVVSSNSLFSSITGGFYHPSKQYFYAWNTNTIVVYPKTITGNSLYTWTAPSTPVAIGADPIGNIIFMDNTGAVKKFSLIQGPSYIHWTSTETALPTLNKYKIGRDYDLYVAGKDGSAAPHFRRYDSMTGKAVWDFTGFNITNFGQDKTPTPLSYVVDGTAPKTVKKIEQGFTVIADRT